MDSETNAKNGNQRPKTSRAAGKEGKTTPKSVGMSREPRGTSVQSLTRGKESNQEPTQKPSGFLGNRREPRGTGDQSLADALRAAGDKPKNRKDFWRSLGNNRLEGSDGTGSI